MRSQEETTATPMNSNNLQNFIDTHRLTAVILPMGAHTATVDDAARALGVDTDRIIMNHHSK
jgi:hypothetical protein